LEQLREGRATWSGGPITVLSVETPGTGTGPTVDVNVRLSYVAATFTQSDGRTTHEEGGISNTLVTLRTEATGYRVLGLRELSSEPS
jgi:hypothetical protein